MRINQVVVGLLKANCYVVVNDAKQAIIIDPGADEAKIEKVLGSNKLVAILLTHGHVDHMGAVPYLVNKYHVPVYAHKKEKFILEHSKVNYSDRYSRTPVELVEGISYICNILNIEGFNIEVIHTPGHTAGSVSYLFDQKYLFSGDFLFKGYVGRTDLYSGNDEQLKASLKAIAKLNPEISVYPGHDEATSIKEELLNNKYLSIY